MGVGDRIEDFSMYRALNSLVHYVDFAIISVMESNCVSVAQYMTLEDLLERAFLVIGRRDKMS